MTTTTPDNGFPQPDQGVVASGLVLLTAALEAAGVTLASGVLGGEYGYGADFSNDVFMMHHYCWCERDDCPWCAGCHCPDTAWKFFIDDAEVTYDAFDQFFEDHVGPYPGEGPEEAVWERQCEAVNTRRRQEHTKTCHWCLHPEEAQPNFLHKPSGSKVMWYKYIGRGMQTDIKAEWTHVVAECLASLSTDPQIAATTASVGPGAT